MSDSKKLRETRKKVIINETSKKDEKLIKIAIDDVIQVLIDNYPNIDFKWEKSINLSKIVDDLNVKYPNTDFKNLFQSSSLKPDGGIIYINTLKGYLPILIGEMKNQGTNKKRIEEGLKKQAKGNAIERLAKNVRGFEMMMISEDIFPFICFGAGCDFEETSTILDRVVTVSLFTELNKVRVKKIDLGNQKLSVGSYFFREGFWTVDEMKEKLLEVCKQSISYYKEKGLV